MDNLEIDEILKSALSPIETPSCELNQSILIKMEEQHSMKWSKKKLIAIACAIICILVIPTTIYAAQRLLSPKEVASEVGDNKLSEAFEEEGIETYQTETDGAYAVTYLGYVNGKTMSDRTGSSWELNPERTYVAAAIERIDGKEISDMDTLFVSPIIQGLKPWVYNIASMNGSYVSTIIDGVLYRIIECDSIEMFSDKKLYLIVSDTPFYSVEAYDYNEETGLLKANEAYEGTNILFNMELDSNKADSEKAEAYIKQLEDEWNSQSETTEDSNARQGMTEKDISEFQKEKLYTDVENGINIKLQNDDPYGWESNGEYAGTTFSYYLTVEGDNIESLTYTLNKGEFCYWPRNDVDARKLYGNKYSISYEEQKDIDYYCSVNVNAIFKDYGYDEEYLKNLGEKDSDAIFQLYHDVLNEMIESIVVTMEIKMKDGSIIEKQLLLENLDVENSGFLIDVSLK
jgi:hypothetical protein